MKNITLLGLVIFVLTSCLSDFEIDAYNLSVSASGLSSSESVTVSNETGQMIRINGTADLSETRPQYFSKGYPFSNANYSVSIDAASQPSPKTCEVLNPAGKVSVANRKVRVSCGYSLFIGDPGDVSPGNTVTVSNGSESLTFGSGGFISFTEKYLDGDIFGITVESTAGNGQTCEILGADITTGVLYGVYSSAIHNSAAQGFGVSCGNSLSVYVSGLNSAQADINAYRARIVEYNNRVTDYNAAVDAYNLAVDPDIPQEAFLVDNISDDVYVSISATRDLNPATIQFLSFTNDEQQTFERLIFRSSQFDLLTQHPSDPNLATLPNTSNNPSSEAVLDCSTYDVWSGIIPSDPSNPLNQISNLTCTWIVAPPTSPVAGDIPADPVIPPPPAP